ncbi:MAG: amidohydrolase [Microscillaceae bacterium]|jgi:predicted amidohydrolase|nr:amidohydrolase [Microscillaceae bacterium]
MTDILTLTLIQTSLHWQDAAANRAMLEEKIWQIGQSTDLIILPEMFTTGFTMQASELAEPMNLHTFKWLKQMAAQTNAVIMGSYIVQENGQYFNRLVWMQPNGEFAHYDKRHLFRMAEEHQTYTGGTKKIIQNLKNWRICPLICYDLRFPVWSRNLNLEYDMLVYVANWPQARNVAWRTLLQARAIENLSYCVGVNRVGTDGKGIYYSGDSAVIDFKGTHLFQKADEEAIFTITLNKNELLEYRQKFPANLDADKFAILE